MSNYRKVWKAQRVHLDVGGGTKDNEELLATKKVLLVSDDPKDAPQVCKIIPEGVACGNNDTKLL